MFELNILDGRKWVSLSAGVTPYGYSAELVPEADRALRPVEILSITVAGDSRDFSIQAFFQNQVTAWSSILLDGTLRNVALRDELGNTYHVITILDDALNGDLGVVCCVRRTTSRIVIATYERVGLNFANSVDGWIRILASLTQNIFGDASGQLLTSTRPANELLLPHLSSYLAKATGPGAAQLQQAATMVRTSSDAIEMCIAVSKLLSPMAEESVFAPGPPIEVREELTHAAEHVALFSLRAQNEAQFGLATSALARFLVDDENERPEFIDRALRLSKYLCERPIDLVFEQASFTYIVGTCRRSAMSDRDDAIDSSRWLIDILCRRPAVAARIIFRLLWKPVSPKSDKPRGGRERLNRLDLATWLMDIMSPLAVDTMNPPDRGIGRADCPREIVFKPHGPQFPLFTENGGPMIALTGLVAQESYSAQRDILGFEPSEKAKDETSLNWVRGLYLRSFRQTRRLMIPNCFVPDGASIEAFPIEPSSLTLEASLHRNFVRVVHVFAFAGPQDALGMGHIYTGAAGGSKDRNWQEEVVRVLKIVQFVVYVPDDTESMQWEAAEIGRSGMTKHTIFVMVPDSVDERAESRWLALRSLNLPNCSLLPPFDPAGAFVWLEQEQLVHKLPFEAVYDRRLSNLALAVAKPKIG